MKQPPEHERSYQSWQNQAQPDEVWRATPGYCSDSAAANHAQTGIAVRCDG